MLLTTTHETTMPKHWGSTVNPSINTATPSYKPASFQTLNRTRTPQIIRPHKQDTSLQIMHASRTQIRPKPHNAHRQSWRFTKILLDFLGAHRHWAHDHRTKRIIGHDHRTRSSDDHRSSHDHRTKKFDYSMSIGNCNSWISVQYSAGARPYI